MEVCGKEGVHSSSGVGTSLVLCMDRCLHCQSADGDASVRRESEVYETR